MTVFQQNLDQKIWETPPYPTQDPFHLETLSYKDLAALLTDEVKSQNGKIDSYRFIKNLVDLSPPTSSPRTISFLWLYASQYSKDNIKNHSAYIRHTDIFKSFWGKHRDTIRDFLSEASLDFLSENYQCLSRSMFNSNEINRILFRRLKTWENKSSPHDSTNLLRVYRGLRLMPPLQLIENVAIEPVRSHSGLTEYISLLHGISRAGLSIAHTNLLEPITAISWGKMVKKLDTNNKNTLLWSLTSQFAFAHDGGTNFSPPIQQTYESILDHMRRYAQSDRYLRRTFNMASIMLDRNIIRTKYNDHDHISDSEYKFMHDFREYALTTDERANLKHPDITKHVTNLGRELDGHYLLNDKHVIIEFDGRSHYRQSLNNDGDEPNGSTKLQTHVLQKLFPNRVIIRLHYKLGNSFTALPESEKPETFSQLRAYISQLKPNAYYLDLHHGKLRTQTARALQYRHNSENGITRQPTQM